MKHFIATILVLLLIGCTSAPNTHSPRGLTTTQLSENSYVLSYQTRNGSKQKALELSKQHAAKLTIDKGYDWFTIIEQNVDVAQTDSALRNSVRYPRQQTRCGLLVCTTETTYTEHERSFPERVIQTQLTIMLGKGIKPNNNTYDAHTLLHAH